MASGSAPILSTPAEHMLEESTPLALPTSDSRLSEEQLYLQYEIHRTISEIRQGKWKRIALQFPDDMLIDAPRVFERLRDGLKAAGKAQSSASDPAGHADDLAAQLESTSLRSKEPLSDTAERLCILADTSYGACCVDEVAAEHVDAEVVVHYGRSCLSPTARLPVIYVFTSKPADLDAILESFRSTYPSREEKVCLMADIPYAHHLHQVSERLRADGYSHVFKTDIVRDPSSFLPNRTVPPEVRDDPESLKDFSVFHISSPPTSLLLILSSRIKKMHIFPTHALLDTAPSAALEASTSQLLRRRYALVTRLSTNPIFGILINTLSVANYMDALQHCQDLISRAGKKSYVFVVGKVNAAKVANFSEIGGWVVIGCWESSLIESQDFYRPIITPFELEAALTDDKDRLWGGEWIGDFSSLLGRERHAVRNGDDEKLADTSDAAAEGDWDDGLSEDEPPEFDLRTGKYVSHTRPMGRPKNLSAAAGYSESNATARPPSSALIQRAKGDVATMGGQVSPAAEFLRSKRTWQGLGSDHEVAYERDDEGRIRGATMEEGRSGIAKGYSSGAADVRS